MDKNEFTVTVIGSGPVGLVSTLILLENDFKVNLVDIGATFENSTKPQSSKLKTIYGFDFPYDTDNISNIAYSKEVVGTYPSKGKFGFSTVWGATWRRYDCLNSDAWINAYKYVEEIVFKNSETINLDFSDLTKNICNCFSFAENRNSKEKIRLTPTKLAYNYSKCISCGKCQLGCPYNYIWSAEEIFNVCANYKNFKYTSNFVVKRILDEGNGVTLTSTQGNNLFTNHLIVAAGPLGTANILLNSGISKKIVLKDTRMIYVPLLDLSKQNEHPGSFTLSPISFMSESRLSEKFFAQLYAHIESSAPRIVSTIRPKIFKVFFGFILKILASKLKLSLIYLSADFSPELILESNGSQTSVAESRKLKLKHKFRVCRFLSTDFRLLSLLPIYPVIKWGSTGGSYHSGAATGVDASEFGILKQSQNIQLVGSFMLPDIEPGPILASAMAHSAMATAHTVLTLNNILDV